MEKKELDAFVKLVKEQKEKIEKTIDDVLRDVKMSDDLRKKFEKCREDVLNNPCEIEECFEELLEEKGSMYE